MNLKLIYKGQSRSISDIVMVFSSKNYEALAANPSLQEHLIKSFEHYFQPRIYSLSYEQFSSLDKTFQSILEDLSKEPAAKASAKVISNNLSFSLVSASMMIKEKQLFRGVRELFPDSFSNHVPNLGLTIFKCGKPANSKVKFERFIIFIMNHNKMSPDELQNLIIKLYTSVRKVLTSGKQGENGVKLNVEGSYNCPNDTINDAIKLIEEIIKDSGESSKLGIGIECSANNYYNAQTKLYEMDGMKKPPDADQLIDFYLKFCNDHPLINFLEDPIADVDIDGWKKIMTKFQTKQTVKISCKSMIDESLHNIKQYNEIKTDEEIPAEERQKLNDKIFVPNNISFRSTEVSTFSDLEESIGFINKKLARENKTTCSLWDGALENEGANIIDLAVGFGAANIILHGFNNKSDRINKYNRYAEIVREIY